MDNDHLGHIYEQMQEKHLRHACFELQEFLEMFYSSESYRYWEPRIKHLQALINGETSFPENITNNGA